MPCTGERRIIAKYRTHRLLAVILPSSAARVSLQIKACFARRDQCKNQQNTSFLIMFTSWCFLNSFLPPNARGRVFRLSFKVLFPSVLLQVFKVSVNLICNLNGVAINVGLQKLRGTFTCMYVLIYDYSYVLFVCRV